jgi:histidyl-tRNA synthetase
LRRGIPAIPFGILIKAEDAEKNVLTLKNLLTREQFTDISVEEAGKIILESKN